MSLQKICKLTAAALACGLLLAAPLSAGALTPDVADAATLEQQNSGYLALSEDELIIEIPSDETSVTEYLYVQYAEDAYDRVVWHSSDTHVATVDNGAVTAWAPGTTIITAQTDTGAVGSCMVTVTREKTARLNRSFVEMEIEYNNLTPRYQLYLQSADGYDSIYQWRSNNPSVATVDRNGVVTAYAEGNATIYANTIRGTVLSCKIMVYNNIGKVTLNSSRMYLESIGAQGMLTASVAVADPSTVGITWTSSNTAAAIVDANGLVTAVGDGEAIITATSTMGRSAECKVYTGTVGVQKKQEAESFFGLGGWFQDVFG